MNLIVEGMTCGHCARAVTAAIATVDPAAIVEVDLAGKQVSVQSGTADADLFAAAIADAGYEVAREAA